MCVYTTVPFASNRTSATKPVRSHHNSPQPVTHTLSLTAAPELRVAAELRAERLMPCAFQQNAPTAPLRGEQPCAAAPPRRSPPRAFQYDDSTAPLRDEQPCAGAPRRRSQLGCIRLDTLSAALTSGPPAQPRAPRRLFSHSHSTSGCLAHLSLIHI